MERREMSISYPKRFRRVVRTVRADNPDDSRSQLVTKIKNRYENRTGESLTRQVVSDALLRIETLEAQSTKEIEIVRYYFDEEVKDQNVDKTGDYFTDALTNYQTATGLTIAKADMEVALTREHDPLSR